MRETHVRSLGRENPLEKEMATHSSILAWRIPWTEEFEGLQSTGRKESDTTERLHFHFICLGFGISSAVWALPLIALGHTGSVYLLLFLNFCCFSFGLCTLC